MHLPRAYMSAPAARQARGKVTIESIELMSKPARMPSPAARHAFNFAGEALQGAWKQLHLGDLEPWPDAQRAKRLLALPGQPHAGAAALAAALQAAWRAYHEGEFESAHAQGMALGVAGASVTIKAGGTHARHMLGDAVARRLYVKTLIPIAEALRKTLPGEANSHYRLAYVLSLHLQNMAPNARLDNAQLQVQHMALQSALQIAPRHAEAQLALGIFHATLVGRMGAIAAKMRCGANATAAEHHLETARRLMPANPLAWLETGNALLTLAGMRRSAAVTEAFERAAKLTPHDAAEALDAAWARTQLH